MKVRYRIRQIKTRRDKNNHPYTFCEKVNKGGSVVKQFTLNPKRTFEMCENNVQNVCNSPKEVIEKKVKKFGHDLLCEHEEPPLPSQEEIKKIWEITQ